MEPKQQRQGRWHRDPAKARAIPLEAIPKGAEILVLLDQAQFLTGRQVANRFFTVPISQDRTVETEMARATRAANRSLFRLKDRGWVRIEPVFTMVKQSKRLTAIELNVLTESGIETVRRLYASDPQTWGLAPSTNAAIEFVPELIKHEVAVRDALIGLIRLFESHQILVAWWTFDSRAWIASGGTNLIQAPDLILTAGEDRVPLLVEVDMGTESIDSDASNSWRTKIARYENYLGDLAGNDPLFEGCQKPQVLVITPAGERLRNLHRATDEWGSPGHWWLTTLLQLEAAVYVPPGEVFLRSGMLGEQSLAEWIWPKGL